MSVLPSRRANRARLVYCIGALSLALTPHANAQQGCVNSPENPTAVLLLVGAAGAAIPGLRARLRHRTAKATRASSAPVDFTPGHAEETLPPAV